MINKTILVGRLTRDPELRKTGTGKSVTNFTVAVNRSFAKDETDMMGRGKALKSKYQEVNSWLK